MSKNYKTTKEQYELFKSECLRLQKEWGLIDWNIAFEHKVLKDAYALIVRSSDDRAATIALTSDYGWIKPTEERIMDHAKHEMIHLMLGDFRQMANCRFGVMEDDLQKNEEQLVVRLCKLIKE